MPDRTHIPADVREKLAALAQPRPMRRGSLSERHMKCNKAGCPCAKSVQGRHGPYFSLTRQVEGRTRSRLLTAEKAVKARAQVEAGHQFRENIEEYWQACEQWADAELEAPEAASQEAAKKGASKKPSRKSSSPRSRH